MERWRYALDRRGIEVSRSKTECMFVNVMETRETVNHPKQQTVLKR